MFNFDVYGNKIKNETKIAVKLYSKMPANNPNVVLGIDGKIPAEVLRTEAPNSDYVSMTIAEYREYLKSIKTEMEQWKQLDNPAIVL